MLNETATGNISITASTGDIIVKTRDNARLTGAITISTSANVTIRDMDITMNKSVEEPTGSTHIISVSGSDRYHPRIILTNNIITFDDVKTAGGYTVQANTYIAGGSAFTGNTINNVSGQAISFKGVADGGTVTVRGNTVTMNPNKVMGAPGSSEDGRALLKVWYVPTQLTLSNGATFIVEDNVVSIVAGNDNKVNVVRVDAINSESSSSHESKHENDDKIIVKRTNNTLDGDPGSSYLFGGASTIYGGTAHASNWAWTSGQLKELRVNLTDDIAVLTPGLNQIGVKWNGGDVEITEGGNYQITHTESVDNKFAAFATMTISADNVFINGNDLPITLPSGNDKAILVNDASVHNVALEKLNITLGAGDNLLYVGFEVTPLDLTISDSIL